MAAVLLLAQADAIVLFLQLRLSFSVDLPALILSSSLQQAPVDASVLGFSNASLQAFALMIREFGRLMSTLVQTRHQV